jgi:D-alanyl-D-alanine carboxypeptidase (penicillin-binding protein 5/6)
MKRKIYLLILSIISLTAIIFQTAFSTICLADEIEINCKSKSAYLMDAHSGMVVYSKNETKRLPIASMCKIMTLLLCFEAQNDGKFSIDDEVVISENAANMGGSQVFLEKNGKYLIGNLIKSIVVASANDACVAMAEVCSGSESLFVESMNEKAKKLNMNDTNFVNCTGLPKPGQYSSAKDVAIMFSELIKHPEYFKYSRIWTDKIIHDEDRMTEITNTNKLIRFYQGCDSGKTGYTVEAGHCLAASAVRNDMRLISVIISAPSSKTRFKEVSSMFNYGFANYVNKLVVDDTTPLDLTINVERGKKSTLLVSAEKPFYLFSKKGEKRSVEISFLPNKRVIAPILKGEIIGELCIYENGIELARINVISNEDVLEKTYFDVIKDISKNWALI